MIGDDNQTRSNHANAVRAERTSEMAIRTVGQIAAGVLAGAVLVGVPTWAVASPDEADSDTGTNMSEMMSDSEMKTSMSKMMKDPEMRKEMASMMSDAMAQMPGMGGGAASDGDMSGMGAMKGMGGMPDASPRK